MIKLKQNFGLYQNATEERAVFKSEIQSASFELHHIAKALLKQDLRRIS